MHSHLSFIAAAGNVGGVLLGHLIDRFRYHKVILTTLLTAATLSLIWFAFLVENLIPPTLMQVFAAATLAGLFVNSAIPIFFELSIEATHPIPEATVCKLLYCVTV